MSRRTPQYSTHNNDADNIERYLQEDGHRTWGFVIYRCTYESDDYWGWFIGHLRDKIRHTLELCNGLDMMDSLGITVFEDRSILDGASTSVVVCPRAFQAMGRHCTAAGARHGASPLPALQVLRAGGRRSIRVCHPRRTVASATLHHQRWLCQPHMEGLGAVHTGSYREGRRADRRLHAATSGLDEGRLPRRHGGHVLLLARLERLVRRVSPPS
jgi:hypothetical protein